MLLKNIKELRFFILGLILVLAGFFSLALIGITAQLYGVNITRHYLLTATGLILILFGIVSMYFFVRQK